MGAMQPGNAGRAVLWGPSEHVHDDERAELARGLERLGLIVDAASVRAEPADDARVLVINTKTPVDAHRIAALQKLSLIVTTTSGHDHIDLAAARASRVRVVRCPLARRDAVVDTTIGMTLALLRRLPRLQRRAERGDWARREARDLEIPLLRELTVGVFGAGVIGARAVEAWRALGANVLSHDPAFAGTAPQARVLADSDIVTLHCSLTPSSRGLIGAAEIAAMKLGVILVNTARGECVDLDALLASRERFGGVGLDVYDVEPCPRLAELAKLDNVLLLPHSAGAHRGIGRAINAEVLDAVGAHLRGEPLPHAVA